VTDTDTLLEVAFQCTQPEVSSNEEKYASTKVAVRQLRELLPQIEAAIGALRSAGSCIVPKDGMPGKRFNKLQRSMEETATQIRWALILTHRPNTHSADLVSYCITFLASICTLCDVEEKRRSCSDLHPDEGARLFEVMSLRCLASGAVESGRIRKRVKAYIKAQF
jgi:hypothetical protein